jgi:predicted nucleic acid-binding protein
MNKKELKHKAQHLAIQAIASEIWKLEKKGVERELLLEMDNQLIRIEKALGWYPHGEPIIGKVRGK